MSSRDSTVNFSRLHLQLLKQRELTEAQNVYWLTGMIGEDVLHDNFILIQTFESIPNWGAADAEIKVPSGETTELKRSPFKAWSRSCYAYCQGFLPCLILPIRSIHLHFLQNLSRCFPVLAVADTGSCVGPQNKIGHPAGGRFPG